MCQVGREGALSLLGQDRPRAKKESPKNSTATSIEIQTGPEPQHTGEH